MDLKSSGPTAELCLPFLTLFSPVFAGLGALGHSDYLRGATLDARYINCSEQHMGCRVVTVFTVSATTNLGLNEEALASCEEEDT